LQDWFHVLHYGQLSPRAEVLLRIVYGSLLLWQLILTLPIARYFFVSQTHRGYLEPKAWRDRIFTKQATPILMTIWIACALSLISGHAVLLAALVNVVLARYFFVHTRWQGLLRGMGAPGHMNYWFACLIACLAICEQFDAHGILRATTVTLFRLDFAGIMFAAGVYKITAGYARNEGVETCLVNPWWSHFPNFWRRFQSNFLLYRILNHFAYGIEIVSAIGYLSPLTAPYAGLLLGGSFFLIGRMIRLSGLADMVASTALLFVWPGDVVDTALMHLPIPTMHLVPMNAPLIAVPLALLMTVYCAALIPAYIGMGLNFYGKRRLTPRLQQALDWWSRTFGLILWRVFTTDVMNFYITIETIDDDNTRRPLDSRRRAQRTLLRYPHVGEAVCLTTVFTTLKYYPQNHTMFSDRLLNYARSLDVPNTHRLIFTYTAIERRNHRFIFTNVAEFIVDCRQRTITERSLSNAFSIRSGAQRSPVKAGTVPGSYSPAPTLPSVQ